MSSPPQITNKENIPPNAHASFSPRRPTPKFGSSAKRAPLKELPLSEKPGYVCFKQGPRLQLTTAWNHAAARDKRFRAATYRQVPNYATPLRKKIARAVVSQLAEIFDSERTTLSPICIYNENPRTFTFEDEKENVAPQFKNVETAK
jgi:hypothetical protein